MQTSEERAKYKSTHARVHLEMRNVEDCRVLPNREILLDYMKSGGVVAEIGVAFGDFTSEIITRCSPRKLHLIDAWDTDRYKQGFEHIQQKFRTEIDSGVVEFNQGFSTVVLDAFDDGYFDWVYIDTNHSYNTTKAELELASQKCRHDGRISGHDFTSGNCITPVPYGVIEACNEFCVNHGWAYEYLTLEFHGHFSFCLKKI